METNTDMPRMTPIAPIVDQLQRLAEEHVPRPRTCQVKLWEDGDYQLIIWHGSGYNEREGLIYDHDDGIVCWRRAKNPYWKKVCRVADREIECISAYEIFEEREIMTLEPPI